MYEYVSDILRAMKLDPKDVILIRHAPNHPEFMAAREAGFIKEYTAMQEAGFSKGRNYLMVFIGEDTTLARYYETYHIGSIFPNRKGRVPEAYPNRKEETAEGDFMELREQPLPPGLTGFAVDWGRGTVRWHQKAEREKRVVEIQTTQKTERGGAQV